MIKLQRLSSSLTNLTNFLNLVVLIRGGTALFFVGETTKILKKNKERREVKEDF